MSQVPTDWSFAQEFEDEEDVPAPPPVAAPKKQGRPGVADIKALAREKVDNLGSLVEASRFIYSALDVLFLSAQEELKKVEARKPRAPKAAAAASPPAASQAALACEDAVISKPPAARQVKRVRAASPEPAVVKDGSGGAGAASAVHYHDPQGINYRRPAPGPRAAQHTGVHTGVLSYKRE